MIIIKIIKENRRSLIYIVLLLFCTIVFSTSLIYLSFKYQILISSFSLLEWILIFFLLSFAMALALTSTTIVALLCSYFLGWYSLAFYTIVYLIATLIGNFLASQIDKGRFLQTLNKISQTGRYTTAIEKDQLPLIILARFSPIFPFSIMNVFLAASNFSIFKILLGSFIGMLPRTLICFWIGTQFHELSLLINQGLTNKPLEWGALILSILSFAGMYIYFKRLKRKIIGDIEE